MLLQNVINCVELKFPNLKKKNKQKKPQIFSPAKIIIHS